MPLGDIALAQRWLQYAQDDLACAELLGSRVGPALSGRNACWLSQQAAEKAIKALLIAYDLPVEFTHNLVWLAKRLPPDSRVSHLTGLELLSEAGMDSRYPDDLPDDSQPVAVGELVELAHEVVALAHAELAWLDAAG